MPRRRSRPANVASDAGGARHYRPPTTGQARPPAGARGPAHAKLTGPQKAAINVGKAVEKGSVPISHGVNRTVGHVLAEADREHRQKQRKAAQQQQQYLKQIGEGRPRTVSISGRAVKPEPIPPVLRTLSAKPFHYEDISDFAIGKAGTNLLFHGSTAHPGAAALELGTLLPVFRGPKALAGLLRGAREAKDVAEAGRIGRGAAPATRGIPTRAYAKPDAASVVIPAKTQLWHTTHRGEQVLAEGFTASKHGESGPGLYLTDDPAFKNRMTSYEATSGRGGKEREAFGTQSHRPLRLLDRTTPEGEQVFRNLQFEASAAGDGPQAGLPSRLKALGYDGVRYRSGTKHGGDVEVVLHDPSVLQRPPGPPVRTPPTPEAAARRFKILDKEYRKTLRAVADQHFEVDPTQKRINQAFRNRGTKRERANIRKTQNQEIMDAAEQAMIERADKHPDQPWAKLVTERNNLKTYLDDLSLHALGPEVPDQGVLPTGKAAGGAPPVEPPKPPTGFGEVPIGPWRNPEKAIQQGLKSAGMVAKGRKAAMSEARAARLGEMRKAGRGLAGEERLYAELGAAKGKLIPDTDFEKFAAGVLPEEKYLDMLEQIKTSPALQEWESLATRKALNAAYHDQKPLRPFEVRNMVKVFGPEAEVLAQKKSPWSYINDVFGMSRSLQTTLDLSLNLRQALPLMFRNPKLWSKSIRPQIKVLLSENRYREAEKLLHADPDMQEALKVNPRIFTSIEHHGGLDRPEFYPSTAIETPVRVKGVNVNAPGKVIRSTGRAFEVGQNLNIINSYKAMKARAVKWGIDINPDTAEGRRELGGMLEVAGAQSGRGVFKTRMFQGAQDLLGHGLYAPSYYKGRLTWFSPRWYKRLPKVARYEAIRTMAQFLGGTAAIAGGVTAAGLAVGRDPRSADFGKIRIGNTRLDTMGGFQQWARLGAQLMSMTYVDSNTGRAVPLVWAFRHGQFGDKSAYDVLLNFATGKASPPVSLGIDFAKGSDYQHRDFEWKRELATRMTPLVAQDMITVLQQTHNPAAAAGAYLFSAAGGGVQTYRPRDMKTDMANLRKAFLAENRKQGVNGLSPELEQQMKTYELRYGAYRKAGLKSNMEGYQKEAFNLDLETLGKMGQASPSQRAEWRSWADRHTDDEISKQRAAWTREFFPTDWLNRAAKETGQKVPR